MVVLFSFWLLKYHVIQKSGDSPCHVWRDCWPPFFTILLFFFSKWQICSYFFRHVSYKYLVLFLCKIKIQISENFSLGWESRENSTLKVDNIQYRITCQIFKLPVNETLDADIKSLYIIRNYICLVSVLLRSNFNYDDVNIS